MSSVISLSFHFHKYAVESFFFFPVPLFDGCEKKALILGVGKREHLKGEARVMWTLTQLLIKFRSGVCDARTLMYM